MATGVEQGEEAPPDPSPAPEEPARGRFGAFRARRRARLARRSRLSRWVVRTGLAILIVIVVLVASTGGYVLYRSRQVHHFTSRTIKPASGPTENFLLIGSTSRCAASKIAQFRYQCLAQQVNGVNSDVVLIARLDGRNDTVSLLSLPRDTFVPGARSGGLYNKIDAALADGPDQLSAAIEQDFGIPINHIVDLNFATFESVVNALGGLWMYFPDRLVDASSGLNVHHTGCIHFNGSEALELVRARHLYWFAKGEKPNYAAIDAANGPYGPWYTANSGGHYDGTGDLGRIVRVHLFLKALSQQVAARGLGNLATDNALIGAVAPNLTVDSSLGFTQMVRLAFDFRHVNLGTAPELTLPTINDAATYYYKGYNYGDVIFPAEPQDQQVIDHFLGTTPAGWALRPHQVSVSVIDGNSSPAEAAAVGSQLAAQGYRVLPTTASNPVGPVSETTVLYDGPSHLAAAQKVMSSLAGAVVLGVGKPAGGAEVSVIAGSDVRVVKPPAPRASAGHKPAAGHASTTSSSPSSSTSAPATTSAVSSTSAPPVSSVPAAPTSTLGVPTTTNPNLGAPTPPSSPVPAFDPRSCPAIP